MGLSLKPEHLKRYAALARLLVKYGRSDVVERAGLLAAAGGGFELGVRVSKGFSEFEPRPRRESRRRCRDR